MDISPLAPKTIPKLPAIDGVMLAAKHAGVKYRNKDKLDVTLIECAEGTQVAGVLTKSKTASANIEWGRKALAHGTARALIVNSGNANAFNGKNGEDSVDRIVKATSELLGCDEHEVYPCATGVIGEPLADDKITDAIAELQTNLTDSAWEDAASAIMTTDTYA
ncbi:MAG: bifunctional ornithine acetyltransferase/N-acetylglutamate synthase, partial [Rickettsiales bacterium]|nr:bifunctional ornithine acetyltransferase/N-acetylglutamate synthase [Rickettsiales bacterium]